MATKSDSLFERVQSSYKQLSVAASNLNTASDDLGKTVSLLDAALKKLGLGIQTWLETSSGGDEYGNFWKHYIGYARVGGKWGIAVSAVAGEVNGGLDQDDEWLFNDAPRFLRIEAVDKIPDLLDKMIKEAEQATEKIKKKATEAQRLAAAISELSPEPAVKRK